MSKILFWLFIGAGFATAFFVSRFIAKVRSAQLLGEKETDALSRLLISGSDGSHNEWGALLYILGKGYSKLGDADAIRAGDCARIGWFISFALMILTGMSLMVWGW
ncbi:MAG: hypothetical protein QM749_00070 [Aquabacterium sp.]